MLDFVKAESPKNPVTEADIAAVERDYEVRFPELLKRYYLEHNGQKIAPMALMIDGLEYCVLKITQLKDPGMSLERLLHSQRLQNFPVRQMIPIADDRANGIYYLHTGADVVYYSTLGGEDDFVPICRGIGRFFEILDEASRRGEDDPLDITAESEAAGVTTRDNFLPLGSVVELQGAQRKVCIVSRGLNVERDDDTFFYDYGGVAYPDGIVNGEIVYFNADGIVREYFHGYADDEDAVFQHAMREYLNTHPNINYGQPYQ